MTSSTKGELHLLLFLSALVLLGALLIAGTTGSLRGQAVEGREAASIAVEHEGPLTVTVSAGAIAGRGIAEIRHDAVSAVAVSVPSAWQLREIRGAELQSAPADPQAMGFTRWQAPPGATLSFWTDGIAALWVYNPSPAPLLIIGKRVDVEAGTVEEKSVLVQERAARLW